MYIIVSIIASRLRSCRPLMPRSRRCYCHARRSGSAAAAAATKETRVHAHYLVSLVLEYMASLQAVKLMPSTNLCLLLVTLLVKIERYDQLLQLIQVRAQNVAADLIAALCLRHANDTCAPQYHILPDSPDMAKRLLSLALRLCARCSAAGERDDAMALRFDRSNNNPHSEDDSQMFQTKLTHTSISNLRSK